MVDWDHDIRIVHISPPIDPLHLCCMGNMGPGVPKVLMSMIFFNQRRPIAKVGLRGSEGTERYENTSGRGKFNWSTIYWTGC